MQKHPSIVISLVVFDGDDTLWYALDGGFISGTDWFDEGRADLTFKPEAPGIIRRNDGRRFRLYPEVLFVLAELKQRNVLISLASYNHASPVMSALDAFGIRAYFKQPAIAWSSQKDQMLKEILAGFSQMGYLVRPETTLFIDDDKLGRYRKQMAKAHIHFLQKGVEILDLREILNYTRFNLVSAQRNLLVGY